MLDSGTENNKKELLELWNMVWPVALIVLANTFYNISQKSTPQNINGFAALTVTYLIAAMVTAILFVATAGLQGVGGELHKLNWASFILGVAIVGLELGYIFLYRAGWKVSNGALVTNTVLAIVLIFVGVLIYKESISVKQILGMLLCTGGLMLITK